MLRELDKLAPSLRFKESLQSCSYEWRQQGAITREVRLFNKNIAYRKSEKMRMIRDACPVPALKTLVQQG